MRSLILALSFLSLITLLPALAQADTFSIIFVVDGKALIEESFDFDKTTDKRFGIATPSGYVLNFETEENKHEASLIIKTSISKDEQGNRILVAKPTIVATWGSSALIELESDDSSLSLKIGLEKTKQ